MVISSQAIAGQFWADTIATGDTIRDFHLYRPANFDPRDNPPVLMVLHGGGGSALRVRRYTNRQFERLADKYGALILYPDALNDHWNDGRKARRVDPASDVAFLKSIRRFILRNYGIRDPKMYLSGISNEGMMTQRMVCESDFNVTGFALVASLLITPVKKGCQPSPETRTGLIFFGTDDPLIPYEGGQIEFFFRDLGQSLSFEATVQFWRQFLNLNNPPDHVTTLPDRAPDDGTRIHRTLYRSPDTDRSLGIYKIRRGATPGRGLNRLDPSETGLNTGSWGEPRTT